MMATCNTDTYTMASTHAHMTLLRRWINVNDVDSASQELHVPMMLIQRHNKVICPALTHVLRAHPTKHLKIKIIFFLFSLEKLRCNISNGNERKLR